MKKKQRNRRAEDAPPADPPAQGKLSELLEIPQSAILGGAQIELSGNREALVDGCRGVLEYDEGIVKLAVDKMSVCFTGRDLRLKALTRDTAVVTGFITNIQFIS